MNKIQSPVRLVNSRTSALARVQRVRDQLGEAPAMLSISSISSDTLS